MQKLQQESLLSEICIFYTKSFQVPSEKNLPHLQCQFSPKIPIEPKSFLYKLEKLFNTPPPHPHHPERAANCWGQQFVLLPFRSAYFPQICVTKSFTLHYFTCFIYRLYETRNLPKFLVNYLTISITDFNLICSSFETSNYQLNTFSSIKIIGCIAGGCPNPSSIATV